MPSCKNTSKTRGFARLVVACALAGMLALPAGIGSFAFADGVGNTLLGLRITDSSQGSSGSGGQPGSTALGIRVTDTANPTPLSATVTFDSNGGSSVAAQTVTYNTAAKEPTAPTWAGHTFDGWYTAQSGGSKYDFKSPVTQNLTLYAHWTANTFKVTFNANGGTGTMADQTFTYDKAQALTKNAFSRDGYDFLGWGASAGATEAAYTDQQSTTISQDTTLFAVWKIKTYTVSFNVGGGSAVASQQVNHGQSAAKPASDPTRSGYRFDGWFSDAACTTSFDFATQITGNTTVYAKWTAQYTIVFNANEGSGTMALMTMVPGVAQNLTPNAFSRAGYDFTGWNTSADGKGTAYADKASVDLSAAAGDTVTLYAQWALHITCEVPSAAVMSIDATGEVSGQSQTFSSASAGPVKVTAVKSVMQSGASSVFGASSASGVKVVLTPPTGAGSKVEVPLTTGADGVSAGFVIPKQQGDQRGTLSVAFGLALPKGVQVTYLPDASNDIALISYVVSDASL